MIQQLCNNYIDAGHEVTVIASNIGIGGESLSRGNGCKKVGVSAINPLERFSVPYPLFNPIDLYGAISSSLETADVVHLHGFLYMSSILAAFLAKRHSARVVLTEHVGFVSHSNPIVNLAQGVIYHTFGRLCCRNCEIITILNGRVRHQMTRLAKATTPILKIPNGVDTKLFHPPTPAEKQELRQKWAKTKPIVLFVGRMVEKKGIDIVLQLAAMTDGFEFWLCGKGDITFQPPHHNIRNVGLVTQDILSELYRVADVLVLPSEGEGFPLVIQEAMASGLPVVVSDDSVNHEYLDEQVACFVQRDPEDILMKIDELLEDEARYINMSRNAREWALNQFSWKITSEKYIMLYTNDLNDFADSNYDANDGVK